MMHNLLGQQPVPGSFSMSKWLIANLWPTTGLPSSCIQTQASNPGSKEVEMLYMILQVHRAQGDWSMYLSLLSSWQHFQAPIADSSPCLLLWDGRLPCHTLKFSMGGD